MKVEEIKSETPTFIQQTYATKSWVTLESKYISFWKVNF